MKNNKFIIIFFILAVLFLALGVWTTILVKKYEEKPVSKITNTGQPIQQQKNMQTTPVVTQTSNEIIYEAPEGAVSAN